MNIVTPIRSGLRRAVPIFGLIAFAGVAYSQIINDEQTAVPPGGEWSDWDFSDGWLEIGSGSGASGSLTVPAGTEVLYGSIDMGVYASDASGYIEINGENAILRANHPTPGNALLNVGYHGSGEVLVTNEGLLQTDNVYVAFEPGSTGSITVTGPESRWEGLSGSFRIGHGGVGNLSVLNGASVTGGTNLFVGNIRVTDDFNNFLGAGQGELLIEGGSSVEALGNSQIGNHVDAEGTVTVRGPGSLFSVGTYIHAGSSGTGTLQIEDGGTVITGTESTNAALSVGGSHEDSVGHVHITGEGSTLDVLSFIAVGREGTGTLLAEEGATVRSGTYFRLGAAALTHGEATVTGAGSAIEPGTFFQVGFNGTGSLLVTDGGRVEIPIDGGSNSSIGRNETGVGDVTIEGTGSFIQAPRLVMGSDTNLVPTGVGTMLIRDNAELIIGGLLGLRNGSTVELDNGTITLAGGIDPLWPDVIDIQGEDSRIFGTGTIAGDVLIADGGTVTGVGAGIEIDGLISGGGSVDNLTVGGVRVMSETGLLTLNNVTLREDAVVQVAITDFSDANNLLAYDSNTSLAGSHLEVSFLVFIDDPDWSAQILAPGVDHGFASVTVPEGWKYEDGLLSIEGDAPPPPPPAFVSNFTHGGDNENWTNVDNWDTDVFPDAPNAVAQFGQAMTHDRVQILFSSSLLASPGVLEVGSIRILPDFDPTEETFLIRNFSTGTAGTLKLYGYPETIGGELVNLLFGNFGYDRIVRFSPSNAGMVIELNNSGAFHNEGGLLRVSTEIIEAGGPQSITKTGEGILRFDRRNAEHSSENSTYSGGFTLTEGIVEWTNSGGASANPFGIGPLTLKAGTLRSTTDTGRSLNTSIVLDGGATIGSLEDGFLGNVTVNSAGGSLATTILSDSILDMRSPSNWHQGTSGDGALTKTGPDTLVFTGTGGTVNHSGPTIVAEGMLRLNTTISSSPVTVQSGGSLGFGLSGETGRGIVNPPLTLEEGSSVVFRLEDSGVHDSLQVGTDLNLEGGALVIDLGFTPAVNDTFLLVENWGWVAPNGVFSYGGVPLTEGSRFSVFSGEFSQEFEITYEGGSGYDVVITALGEAASTPYQDWADGYGLTGDDAAPNANPSGDGYTNEAKFAFGADPTVAVAALAQVSRDGDLLVLRWNRSTDPGIEYVIEQTGDLAESWDAVPGAEPEVMAEPDVTPPSGYERVEWTTPAGEDGERAFYSVRAIVNPALLP